MGGFVVFMLFGLFSHTAAIPVTCTEGQFAAVVGDCSKFKQCVWGEFITKDCASGTAWNQDLLTCGPPSDNCQDNNIPECTPGQYAAVEEDCTRYKVCDHGVYRTGTCGLGTVWYQENTICNWPSADDSCEHHDPGTPDDECGNVDRMIPWENCRGFDWCLNGNRKLMGKNGTCADGTRFSPSLQVCVWKGDEYDVCIPENEPDDTNDEDLTIEEYCERNGDGDKLLPHPTECQLYVNCSAKEPKYLGYLYLSYVRECTYPDFFNSVKGTCDDFQNVQCGNRREEEYKFICNYYVNAYSCRTSHCRPCYVDGADCRGLEDGYQAHSGRLNSPFYVTCLGERWVPQEYYECPFENGYKLMFDAEKRECVAPIPY